MMHSDPQTHALLMLAESVKQSHGWLRSGLVQPDAQKNGWTNLLMERIIVMDIEAREEAEQQRKATELLYGKASSSPSGPNTTVNSNWAVRVKPGSSLSW